MSPFDLLRSPVTVHTTGNKTLVPSWKGTKIVPGDGYAPGVLEAPSMPGLPYDPMERVLHARLLDVVDGPGAPFVSGIEIDPAGGFVAFDLGALTPAQVGAGLTFTLPRRIEAYQTESGRAASNPGELEIEAEWMPADNAPPFELPLVAPRLPGEPIVGSVMMMKDSAGVMEYQINAAGTIEGTDDGTRIERFSVQPVAYEKAMQVSSLSQGRKTYCLRGDTRLISVEESQHADWVEIFGEPFECVAVLGWQNGLLDHYENFVCSKVPMAGVSP